MFNLLHKELRLAAHPNLFVFMLMGILVLVPNYPYSVIFLFGCLAPYITFMYGRETRDVYYTALLPIKKGDVVRGKCLLVVFSQLGQLLISVPFAFLRTITVPNGNVVGMEANVAFYGCGLIIYGIFNFILFSQFYKTAQKVGLAFLLGCIPVVLCMIVMEVLPHLPGLVWLDSIRAADLLRQVPILIVGCLVYVLANLGACKVGMKRFERVDL